MTDMRAASHPASPGRVTRRKVSVTSGGSSNSSRQRAAVRKMSECEVLCGFTAEELAAFHAEQRARVLARWGVAA